MVTYPLPQKYIGCLCEVIGAENEFVTSAAITEMDSESVTVESGNEIMPRLGDGEAVKLNIVCSGDGLRVISGNVSEVRDRYIVITSIRTLAEKERRRFFRVEINYRGRIVSTITKAEPVPIYPSEDIIVKNISLSGIYFITKKSLEVGDRVSLFLIRCEYNEQLNCRVRRTEELGGGYIGCGCEFYDGSPGHSAKLCSFIFKQQGMKLRKN